MLFPQRVTRMAPNPQPPPIPYERVALLDLAAHLGRLDDMLGRERKSGQWYEDRARFVLALRDERCVSSAANVAAKELADRFSFGMGHPIDVVEFTLAIVMRELSREC